MADQVVESAIVGKNSKKIGETPAIALCDPKFSRNVGAIIRLASVYGIKQVLFSGNRVSLSDGERLPREERMKGYKDVELIQNDYFFDLFEKGVTPVAVEVRENSENLFDFENPENPLYVFGPEDGSVPKVMLQHCHRFVIIPGRFCLNLATAVSTVLYDRDMKLYKAGKKELVFPGEWEGRGNKESLRDLFKDAENAGIEEVG